MTTDTQEKIQNRCEACFGTGQQVAMRRPIFGQKLPPYVACPACKGTAEKPKSEYNT
jgi:DnaJ-class molecular chaperone